MEWLESTLGEICDAGGGEIKTGPFGSQLHQADYEYDGTPVVMPKDIIDGRVLEDSIARVNGGHVERLARHKLNKGDIVYGRRGDIGRQALVRKENIGWLCGTGCLRVTVGEKSPVSSRFLHLYLKQPDVITWISNQAIGATMPNLNTSILRSVPVRYPEKIEYQDDLTGKLLAYDNLIENNNRRIAILEDMAQSLYREWFVKFRFPGHEGCQFKDSPLGRIPEVWGVVALEDISERITDGAHKSPKSVESGVAMASVKDMHDFGFNLDRCRQISEADYLELERQDSVVKANDILVAKDGSYLKHTFVVEKDLKVALLSSIAMIRSNERVKPHWLAYCLRSDIVKARMKQCVSGVAIPRIILKDFRKFKIYLPSDELMNEWNILVQPMIGECWNLIAKNNNLKAQRDMLLPKLMSGKIGI
jgi:type I restriction enzyme S subunit